MTRSVARRSWAGAAHPGQSLKRGADGWQNCYTPWQCRCWGQHSMGGSAGFEGGAGGIGRCRAEPGCGQCRGRARQICIVRSVSGRLIWWQHDWPERQGLDDRKSRINAFSKCFHRCRRNTRQCVKSFNYFLPLCRGVAAPGKKQRNGGRR